MVVFQNLTILLGDLPFTQLTDKIDTYAIGDWRRERELESWLSNVSSEIACYALENQIAPFRNGNLWLYARNKETYVANIVPGPGGNLSEDQYNAILQKFADELAVPSANDLGLQVTISQANPEIEDIIGNAAASALRAFSSGANKSTGSSHPSDLERWHHFIILSFRAQKYFSTDLLSEWLIEEGWDSPEAHELVIEYEQGLHLLKQYAKEIG